MKKPISTVRKCIACGYSTLILEDFQQEKKCKCKGLMKIIMRDKGKE